MFSIEAVDEEGERETECGRGRSVRRNQNAELCRRDVEQTHQLRSKRHEEGEIEDVRELHTGEQEDEGRFAVRS